MDNVAYKPEEVQEAPREAPPPYSATIVPLLGLDHLRRLSRVDIRQKEVTTDRGDVIFGLKRVLVQKGCSATFLFELFDRTGRMSISLKPVNKCCSPRIEVYIEGRCTAKVKMASFCCRPTYVVTDANKTKVLKVQVPNIGQNRFLLKIKDMQGHEIGSITKKWNGLADEIFADNNVLEIDFPIQLGVQFKAAVIGFCVFIIQEASVQHQYRR